jgi:hypothetical protein
MFKVGKLYKYADQRRLHEDQECNKWFVEVSSETLFVLLDIKETTRIGVVKAYKILTANGDVGWISGLKEYFVELTP